VLSTGGNVLINVAPTAYGKIEAIYQERLRQLGSWLRLNGQAIYHTVPWKHQKDKLNKNVWLERTREVTDRRPHCYCSRYTMASDGQLVFATLLLWPTNTSEVSLAAPITRTTTRVVLLASSPIDVPWRALAARRSGIILDLSHIKAYSLANNWAWVFQLTNIDG
jgi:alpha-L-fucosidase